MARREDFRIELAEPSVRMCDVCAEMCEGPRIATYVGVSSQSDVCMECVTDILRLMGVRAKSQRINANTTPLLELVVA